MHSSPTHRSLGLFPVSKPPTDDLAERVPPSSQLEKKIGRKTKRKEKRADGAFVMLCRAYLQLVLLSSDSAALPCILYKSWLWTSPPSSPPFNTAHLPKSFVTRVTRDSALRY